MVTKDIVYLSLSKKLSTFFVSLIQAGLGHCKGKKKWIIHIMKKKKNFSDEYDPSQQLDPWFS